MLVPFARLALVGILLLPSSPAAHADAATEAEHLRTEVALLKMKLASAEKKLAAGDDAAESSTTSTRPLNEKPVNGLIDVMSMFPDEAQPDRDGNWSQAAAMSMEEHLKYAVWGTLFQDNLDVWSVKIQDNRANATDPSASPYIITLDLHNRDVEYRGITIKEDIGIIRFYADQKLMRRVSQLHKGDTVRVRGSIRTIERKVHGLLSANPAYDIILRRVEIADVVKEVPNLN